MALPSPSLGAPWAPVVAETTHGPEAEPHSQPYVAGIRSSSVLPTVHSRSPVSLALPWGLRGRQPFPGVLGGASPALRSRRGAGPAPGHPLLPSAQPSCAKLDEAFPLLCSLSWAPGVRTRPRRGELKPRVLTPGPAPVIAQGQERRPGGQALPGSSGESVTEGAVLWVSRGTGTSERGARRQAPGFLSSSVLVGVAPGPTPADPESTCRSPLCSPV